MALMVPESISSNASQGEQILYKIFREKLSNDFFIWYGRIALENRLDFLIIAPNLGVLILEVIPWYPSQIISADTNAIQVLYSQNEKTKQREEQQSLSYLDIPGRRTRKRSTQAKVGVDSYQWNIHKYQELLENLSDKLKNYHIITQSDETYQAKLAFPVGCGFVFSNITCEQGQEKRIEQLLTKSQIIYRNELISLQNDNSTSLVDRLKTIFIKNFDFPPLSYEQIDTIKATIFPETAIKLIPVYNDSITNNIQLNRSYGFQTLDPHQECIVRTIGEGHRIIYGVAGSGKTLILICHAKLLISQNPDQKILLICFNRSLAAYLKSILYDYLESQNISIRIEVLTFYAWVNSVRPKIPAQSGFSTEYYDGILGDILLEKLNKIPNSQKYDAILIDEAQTFHPSWFKCCVAALKDPENGNLLIVADGSQSVYKRSNFTWKSVGIKAVGRTSNKRINLDKNYRNTQEILTAAWSLFSYYHTDSENLIFDIVKPIDALRHGLHPILHLEKSEKDEIESVIREIKELKKSGYDLNEMAIIYRMADDKKTVLIDNLIRELNKLQLATYWVSQSRINEKQYSNKNYGIKIISSLSALGLEFKIVFIIWVQDWEFKISPVSESDILTCKRLYVAMTRAQEILHIFGSGNSRLLKQLQNSEYFTIKQ